LPSVGQDSKSSQFEIPPPLAYNNPMSPETPNPDQLFTVPADEFKANYRPLTPAELAELGQSPPSPTILPEELTTSHEAFLRQTFEIWDKTSASKAKITTEALLPTDQNWSDLATDIDPTKFGEMTLNPETQALDFETATVFIPDLSAFNDQPLSAVAEHLISTYGDKYYLPGIEYWQWVCEHKNLTDLPAGPEFEALKQNLKDNYCFFFGSTLRRSDGRWRVPCLDWAGAEWGRYASGLGDDWDSDCRVVLLER